MRSNACIYSQTSNKTQSKYTRVPRRCFIYFVSLYSILRQYPHTLIFITAEHIRAERSDDSDDRVKCVPRLMHNSPLLFHVVKSGNCINLPSSSISICIDTATVPKNVSTLTCKRKVRFKSIIRIQNFYNTQYILLNKLEHPYNELEHLYPIILT